MSRRKKRPQSAQPAPKAAKSLAKPHQASNRRSLLALGSVLAVLAVLGLGVWWLNRSSAIASTFAQGEVTSCKQIPPFAQAQGFGVNAVLDTQARRVRGMVMYDLTSEGQEASQPAPYQHPSWAKAGYLSSPILDRDGAIYVGAVPWVSILYNPPAAANKLYRIDPRTAELSELLDLPTAAPANNTNPYGVLALNYDCNTHSLYVSSVFGSTKQQQFGRIFRVDLASKKASIVLDGVDSFGIGVYNGSSGKRLYYALARQPQIYSIALDNQGNPTGQPRQEIDFSGQGYHGDERGRRITFGDATMQVRIVQFDYTLTAVTNPNESTLSYRYNPENDSWQAAE
ncbi:SMP-30/gluconolactonase/LRE family protein [Herpetosiphon geysericola]|uniref:Uncharacterized protein n=1 Tax=Herpetosiphon geysericola TaxID=70996 RepID=A0A0P6Y0K4_9CHLR|nr:hypothetical protein [Herpetosiphon geysericola]KPL90907.1 hypothetical protein SE18_03765 [Herpetosiphon geysericola]